jgi:thioredoxin-related protein
MFAKIKLFGFCILLLGVFSFTDREKNEEKIQWMTIEEAYAKSKQQPRKILVDIYTDWCGWCKVMDKQTFTNKQVASYINENFYAVKFNAEQRNAVKLDGEQFDFLMRGGKGVHELALRLTNNQLSYPTVVFIDERLQVIQPVPGFMKAKDFHEIITYFGGEYYKKVPFEEYKLTTYPQKFSKEVIK